jgi:hypothetical protein
VALQVPASDAHVEQVYERVPLQTAPPDVCGVQPWQYPVAEPLQP